MAVSSTKHVSYIRKEYRIFCGLGLCTVWKVEHEKKGNIKCYIS